MPPRCEPARVDQKLLDRTLQSLAELSSGDFAERMRLDAAARLLVTVHRVLCLREAGMMSAAGPWPIQRRELLGVERIGAGWKPCEMTASEFISDLPPADVTLMMELCPAWADIVRASLPGLRR